MTDEAHLSAEQPGPRAASRLPASDGDGRRTERDPGAAESRPEEIVRLVADKRLTTLARRADFLAANRGRRSVTPGFILLSLRRADTDGARVGFTVTKKIGNAVVRNRMKRRFRALAREVLAPVALPDRDYVLIGRAGGVEREYGLLRNELVRALV